MQNIITIKTHNQQDHVMILYNNTISEFRCSSLTFEHALYSKSFQKVFMLMIA